MQLPKQPLLQRSQQDTLGDGSTTAPQQQANSQHPPPIKQRHLSLHTELMIGGWQSNKDYTIRRMMIARIVLLLRQRKPDAPEIWLKKSPQNAKRLEQRLYRTAPSLAEYNNVATLKQRLQQLAVTVSMQIQQAQMTRNENEPNVFEV